MKRNIGASHYKQLLQYAKAAEMEGWYYGPRKQFDQRHIQIMAFLHEAIERCENKKTKGSAP